MRQMFLQNITAVLLQNVTKVYYKMRQVFYYKVRYVYNKVQQLLLNATIFLQNATFYYKMEQLLRNFTFITKCVSTSFNKFHVT